MIPYLLILVKYGLMLIQNGNFSACVMFNRFNCLTKHNLFVLH